jgi:hypothetical protein
VGTGKAASRTSSPEQRRTPAPDLRSILFGAEERCLRLWTKPLKLALTALIQRLLTEAEIEQLRQNGRDLMGLLYDGLEVRLEKQVGQ